MNYAFFIYTSLTVLKLISFAKLCNSCAAGLITHYEISFRVCITLIIFNYTLYLLDILFVKKRYVKYAIF